MLKFLLLLFCFNTAFAEDLDTEIEDAKLRTSSGSKSQWSGSFNMNYAGASLTKPFDDERPQIGNFSVRDPVSAAGNFGVRYRLDKNKSLYFAGGYYRARPFNGGDSQSQDEISTPQISLNNTFAWNDTQIGSSASIYITTIDSSKAIGEVATVGYNLSALRYIGKTKIYGGVNFYVWYTNYTAGSDEFREFQIDYGTSLGPQIQYNLNEKLSVYTAISLLNFYHYNARREFDFSKGSLTQTVGIGWSILRDVYVSPYFGFKPDNISNDTIAVNFIISLNLF